jgi:hypothetical protein
MRRIELHSHRIEPFQILDHLPQSIVRFLDLAGELGAALDEPGQAIG